jgi:hypothetical protein
MNHLFRFCLISAMLLPLLGSICYGAHLGPDAQCPDELNGSYNRIKLISAMSNEDDLLARRLHLSWNLGNKLAHKSARAYEGCPDPFPNFPIILYGIHSGCSKKLGELLTSETEKRIFLTNTGLLMALDSSITTYQEMLLIAAGWDTVAAKLNSTRSKQRHCGNKPSGCSSCSDILIWMKEGNPCRGYSGMSIGLGLCLAVIYGVLIV